MILRTLLFGRLKKKTCSNNDNNNLYVHMCYYLGIIVCTHIHTLLFKLTKTINNSVTSPQVQPPIISARQRMVTPALRANVNGGHR